MPEEQIRPRPKPLVVIILDGWGVSLISEGNAIAAADTPTMDTYARTYPSAAVSAAGIEVGLPWGEVGNSETGHRNIGAGQVQYQVLETIDKAIADGSFFKNPALIGAIEHMKQNNSNLHLMGLVSPGGVHAHMNHLISLLEMCSKENIHDRVYIHMFTDGRDAPPAQSLEYLKMIQEAVAKFSVGTFASVTGRFYAMDRNKNWDRTKEAYDMLTGGPRMSGAPNVEEAINQSYRQKVFDEKIVPTAITRGGDIVAPISENDAVIFFNYRPDRARQITEAFVTPERVEFPTKKFTNLYFATMTQYDSTIPAPYAYQEDIAEYPLARVISDAGLTQLHIAETEKYAHVTYYLDVGHEQPYPGEDQVLMPSSNIADFAQEPKMQAEAITNKVIEEIEKKSYDVYFINFANPDMVGHTGNFEATKEACSFVDQCIARIHNATFAVGGTIVVTADHGNAEEKLNPNTGEIETDHTTNPVPFHLVSPRLQRSTPKSNEELSSIMSTPIGVLADIAPTIIDILQLEKPSTMTGVSLLPSLR